MNMRLKLLSCALTLITASSMASASILYSESFNAVTEVPDFSDPFGIYTAGSGVYTVSTGGPTTTPNGQIAPSVIQLNTVGSSDFIISSTFNITGANKGSVGLAAYGNNDSLSSSFYQAYVAQNQNVAEEDFLFLEEIGGDGQITSSAVTTVSALTDGTDYVFTLTGTYSSGSLNLSFNVTGDSINQTINGTDNTPLTGEYFGYRTTRASGATTAVMDDFLIVSVPEPSSVTLFAIGSIGILMGCGRLKRK